MPGWNPHDEWHALAFEVLGQTFWTGAVTWSDAGSTDGFVKIETGLPEDVMMPMLW